MLIRSHVQERDGALRESIGHAGDDGVAKLSFQIRDVIDVAGAADFLMEDLGVRDFVRVDAVAAHAHRAEFLVANGDGGCSAPTLVGFHAHREIINVGLERGLEGLIPIHEVSEDGQSLGVQRVEAGAENVGDLALVDEDGHLGLTHGELAAVLDLHVLHGIAVSQYAVFRFGPLDDINELLGKETHRICAAP